jgi:hypothetical protein
MVQFYAELGFKLEETKRGEYAVLAGSQFELSLIQSPEMSVDSRAESLGNRSWRYSMLVDNCMIETMFIEADVPGEPFEVSDRSSGDQSLRRQVTGGIGHLIEMPAAKQFVAADKWQ